ncbi:MAG: Yqey-like protein [Parcubacteria bacterium OLB19]|nr:MAG: Yqey-like protein [Parcubacteria bacterium OLB19]
MVSNLILNMSIHTDLRTTLKEAMKSKNEVLLRTVRSIMTACTNELVATSRTPQSELSDEETIAVIKRLAKQRKESIVQFEAAGRTELAEPEKEELAILESYLPTLMSKEQIKPIAESIKTELGITDKAKMGMLVGAVMKKLQGQADGADVKVVVESLF